MRSDDSLCLELFTFIYLRGTHWLLLSCPLTIIHHGLVKSFGCLKPTFITISATRVRRPRARSRICPPGDASMRISSPHRSEYYWRRGKCWGREPCVRDDDVQPPATEPHPCSWSWRSGAVRKGGTAWMKYLCVTLAWRDAVDNFRNLTQGVKHWYLVCVGLHFVVWHTASRYIVLLEERGKRAGGYCPASASTLSSTLSGEEERTSNTLWAPSEEISEEQGGQERLPVADQVTGLTFAEVPTLNPTSGGPQAIVPIVLLPSEMDNLENATPLASNIARAGVIMPSAYYAIILFNGVGLVCRPLAYCAGLLCHYVIQPVIGRLSLPASKAWSILSKISSTVLVRGSIREHFVVNASCRSWTCLTGLHHCASPSSSSRESKDPPSQCIAFALMCTVLI